MSEPRPLNLSIINQGDDWSYLTHFDKLFVVACSYNNISVFGSEGLEQKNSSGIIVRSNKCLNMEGSQVLQLKPGSMFIYSLHIGISGRLWHHSYSNAHMHLSMLLTACSQHQTGRTFFFGIQELLYDQSDRAGMVNTEKWKCHPLHWQGD